MQWLSFLAVLLLGRILQLSLLYFTEMPNGGAYVDNWASFMPYAVVNELGYIAAIAAVALALSLVLKKGERIVKSIAFVVACTYIGLSGGDAELMRWMGQHLCISYFTTYASAASEPGLVGRIFFGGLWHFLASIFLAIGLMAATWLALFKLKPKIQITNKLNFAIVGILAVVSVAGITSTDWLNPSTKRFKRIAPVFYNFGHEFTYIFKGDSEPEDYRMGIEFLGGDPDQKYPFYRKVQNEQQNLDAFANLPLEQKPDIVMLTIETFRGWTADIRKPEMCALMPNLCELAKSGVYFAHAYSVGYPSVEGFLGMQTGVWSHPEKSFLSERGATRMRSLPGILNHAGYHRIVLTATEPSFDNLVPWFEKWYDYNEFDSRNQNDVSLANRFIELYRERPKGKPVFFNWMSTTMHVPFTLPKGYHDGSQEGKTPAERYEQTLAYMDSAIGIVINEVKNSDRAGNTIFVLAGDHAYPTTAQNVEYQSGMNPGFVWIPMVFSGVNVPQGVIENRPVSQGSIAQSILDLLNLDVSGNFPNKSLFAKDSLGSVTMAEHFGNALSFRLGEAALFTDSLSYYVYMDGKDVVAEATNEVVEDMGSIGDRFVRGKIKNVNADDIRVKLQAAVNAWEWVVDKNLLNPEYDE